MSLQQFACPSCSSLLPAEAATSGGQVACPGCGLVVALPPVEPDDDRWCYARGREKRGPFPLAELRRLVLAGRLQPTDMVLREGSSKWVAAGSVPLLFPGPTARGNSPPAPRPRRRPPARTDTRPPADVESLPQTNRPPSRRPGVGRRFLNEVLATCRAPVSQTVRLVRHGRLKWKLRAAQREDHSSRLALGQRGYEAGGGDPQLRADLAGIDEEIGRLESANRSTRGARGRRDRAVLQLGDQMLTRPRPPRGVEAAYDRARRAGQALHEQRRKASEAGRAVLPAGVVEWGRLLGGCGVALLGLVVVSLLLWPRRPEPAVASVGPSTDPARELVVPAVADRDRDLGRAIGWVMCGYTVTTADRVEMEFLRSSGSCFAVTPDGYLLTNRHVIEGTWKELHDSDAKQQLENVARQRGHIAQPTVWVFFAGKKYVATMVHRSPRFDLAALKVERRGAPFLRLSSSDSPGRGTRVVACGFPAAMRVALNEAEALENRQRLERLFHALQAGNQVRVEDRFARAAFEFDMTTGSLSRPVTEESGCKWNQHDATIHRGSSGGPLLTDDATVVGINTLGDPNAHGNYRALSIPQLRQELDEKIPGLVWH